MAHLSARLQIIHATTQEALHELKTLYFEYRDLKARRQSIKEAEAEVEAESEANTEVNAGTEAEADAEPDARCTAAPDASSILNISLQDNQPISPGKLHVGTHGLPLWLSDE